MKKKRVVKKKVIKKIDPNLMGAKLAAKKMMKEWGRWNLTKNEEKRRSLFAYYAASAIACKVFIDNYIKHFFPKEQLPLKVAKDLSILISDIERVEITNKGKLEKILAGLDKLSRDIAA